MNDPINIRTQALLKFQMSIVAHLKMDAKEEDIENPSIWDQVWSLMLLELAKRSPSDDLI